MGASNHDKQAQHRVYEQRYALDNAEGVRRQHTFSERCRRIPKRRLYTENKHNGGGKLKFDTGRHTEQAHEYTNELIAEAYRRLTEGNPTTPEERVRKTDELCETHYEQVGVYPDDSVLNRLAWYIIFDEMTDKHPDKITRDEYPVMSEWQELTRDQKTIKVEEITFNDRQFNGRKRTSYVGKNGNIRNSSPRLPNRYDPRIKRKETEIDVEEALNNSGLTERQRRAIEFIFFENLTQEGAAKKLGISRSTLREHVDEGLRKMREYLTKKPANYND